MGKQLNTGRTHFKKGHPTWNKGTKGLTKRNKTSFKKGMISHNKGIKIQWPCKICKILINKWGRTGLRHTCCRNHRNQLIKFKRKNQVITRAHKKAISEGLKGKKKTKEHTAKISGKNNYNWKGGDDNPLQKLRSSFEYKQWRLSVFRRDFFTCRICNKKGGIIWADHIKPFALFPEFRFDLSNGRTLCQECALALPTHGNKVFNYKTRLNSTFAL